MKLIQGVQVKDLVIRADERGMLTEILRSDDKIFQKFGQVYFTTAYPGVVKAWHFHKIQTDFFACVHGEVKLVLYDRRKESPTVGMVNEFYLGIRGPKLVAIPPEVYHGFKCIGTEEAIMINVPTESYNPEKPDEYRVAAYYGWTHPDFHYDWTRKDE